MEIGYQNIFNKLSIFLENDYKNNANNLTTNVFEKLSLKNNFCNERTAAYASTYFMENYLKQNNWDISVINEASFRLISPVTDERKEELKKEVNEKKAKINKTLFCPDAVFFLKKDKSYRVFIEYKVHIKEFKYIELANDYLKYKIYTDKSTISSIFVYVIFNKTIENMPSIFVKGKTPKIQFLKRILTFSDIDDETNIFIYEKTNILSMQNNDKPMENKTSVAPIDIINKLDEIYNTIQKALIKNENFDYESVNDYSKNIYANNIDTFLGNNVATALIIQQHYSKIENIYYELNISLDKLLNKAKIASDSFSDEESMIKWIKKYFPNMIKIAFEKELENSNKALTNGSIRKSVILLIMIKKSCKDNKLNINFELEISSEEKDGIKKLEQNSFIKDMYKIDQYKEKYNLLIESIIYVLVKDYDIVFEKTENPLNQFALAESDKYYNFKVKKKVLELVRDINKSFDKNKSITWDDSLAEFGKKLLGYISRTY